MGIEDTATIGSTAATAAARITELTASQSVLPSRPAGPSARTRPSVSSPPTNLGVVDHVVHCRQEIVNHARTAVPADRMTRPVPRDRADIYTWFDENTPAMDTDSRRVAEAIMLKQSLESAILAGNVNVVRPHRCLNCRCWSLFWQSGLRVAMCLNLRCTGQDGRPSRFTLTQLAEQAVQDFTVRAAT